MSEKKGDILNQLAIISDLLEKVNIEVKNTSVLLEVTDEEFDRVRKYISIKQKVDLEDDESVFSIVIGEIDFVFSKNSV
jgi:hypothetical protein